MHTGSCITGFPRNGMFLKVTSHLVRYGRRRDSSVVSIASFRCNSHRELHRALKCGLLPPAATGPATSEAVSGKRPRTAKKSKATTNVQNNNIEDNHDNNDNKSNKDNDDNKQKTTTRATKRGMGGEGRRKGKERKG